MTLRQEMIDEIRVSLGEGLIDVELEEKNYNVAVNRTLRRYRQRSSNSLQEGFVFVQVEKDVNTYTLPSDIQEIQAVYRRSMTATSGGPGFDPFGAAFANNIYMISNPGGLSVGGSGTLATYDFATQFQKLAGQMFGRDLQFTWNASTKKITFHRKFGGPEEIGLHAYLIQPEEVLLGDPYARPWLQDYALALSKYMLGEAYSKFSSLAGPQGGITLKGEAMKTEAEAEMQRLDLELKNTVDGAAGYTFILG